MTKHGLNTLILVFCELFTTLGLGVQGAIAKHCVDADVDEPGIIGRAELCANGVFAPAEHGVEGVDDDAAYGPDRYGNGVLGMPLLVRVSPAGSGAVLDWPTDSLMLVLEHGMLW